MNSNQANASPSTASAKLERMELFIGNFLRYGVLLCAAVIAVGVLLSFTAPGEMQPPLAAFTKELMGGKLVQLPTAFFCGSGESWGSCWHNPTNVISLGLVLLIALPIVRVALTLVVFVLQRDWIYTAVCGFVLAVLLTGVFLGSDMG